MSHRKIVCLVLFGTLVASGRGYSQTPDSPDTAGNAESVAAAVDYFHDQLSPFGQWTTREGYGMIWVPRVAPGWRPYTTGHWTDTDQGFAWVADESWGWAPFHYGRWYYDSGLGWSWLPGTTWAPAWVAWQSGDGYLGWAPLPPDVEFGATVGLAAAATLHITPGFYTFVREKDFLTPRVSAVIIPSTRNVSIVKNTTNITRYEVLNNRLVNAGVSVKRIQQALGHAVPKVPVSYLSEAQANGQHGVFYRPEVLAGAFKAAHAEFGHTLPNQIALQRKGQAFERASRHTIQHQASALPQGTPNQGQPVRTTGQVTTRSGSSGRLATHLGKTDTARSPTTQTDRSRHQAASAAPAHGAGTHPEARTPSTSTPPPPKPTPRQ